VSFLTWLCFRWVASLLLWTPLGEVARGEDTFVLQYALDNYFSVFIRRGPRPYVVKFRRLF